MNNELSYKYKEILKDYIEEEWMTMSVKELSKTEVEKMAMVDICEKILGEAKQPLNFREAFSQVADVKGWNETERSEKIAQFYTDLNLDGRFLTVGSNEWGLKRWYPLDKVDEESAIRVNRQKEEELLEDEEELEDVDQEVELNGLDDEDDEDDDAKVLKDGFGIEEVDYEDDIEL